MAYSIKLPFRPSSTNCLSWSQDNQIAVIGGEHVAILSPKLKAPKVNAKLKESKESKSDNQHWETTLVKVNGFTAREIPRKDPLSTKNLSLGEELSKREATAAVWSPPGLASHKRCALAVLTADHVLSLWDAVGPPKTSASWKRNLIINHVVREYYDRTSQKSDDEDERAWAERQQIQQRIRAFAWSPAFHKKFSKDDISEAVDWGECFLAVATHGGHILFMHVQSPHTDLSASSTWAAKIVWSLEIPLAKNEDDTKLLFGNAYAADHLAWGEWKAEQDSSMGVCSVAPFAFTVRGKLFVASIRRPGDGRLSLVEATGQPKRYLSERADITGPLQFVLNEGLPSLVAFGTNAVWRVDLRDGDAACSVSHDLDDRWDNISGLAFTADQEMSLYAHFVSELTNACSYTSALELSSSGVTFGSTFQPLWSHSIVHSKRAFGEEFGAGSAVQERHWGITSSPFGNSLAVCFSMHPCKMIEDEKTTGQSSMLCIIQEHKTKEEALVPDPVMVGAPSTEALMYSLQQHLMQHGVGDRAQLVEQLAQSLPRRVHEPSLVTNATGDNLDATLALVRNLRLAVYSHPEMRVLRANYLIDMAMKGDHLPNEAIRTAVQHLSSQMSRLSPDELASDDVFSVTIRKIFAAINRRLDAKSQASDDDDGPEQCMICQQKIPLEGLKWARCPDEHQYPRCWLSFVAIQSSTETKLCGICGLQYLGDKIVPLHLKSSSPEEDIEMVDAPNSDDEPSHESWIDIRRINRGEKPTLGWLLFSACDLCLFCGGKFVG